MVDPKLVPVILGVGEFLDRPEDPSAALEPVALMAEALRAADKDGGGGLLDRLDSLELVASVTWRYADPVGVLCQRLGIAPARKVNASFGGETPIRLVHEAARRIALGEIQAAGIVGGEAMNALRRARKAGAKLDWTPLVSKADAPKLASSSFAMSPSAKKLGMVDPAQVYPLYEMAAEAAWGQTPDEGIKESAALWARYAQAAAKNPYAWLRTAPDAAQISTVSDDNRMINWPYPKLMVANPQVNQAAAIIVTSLALAREAGVAEDSLVYIWGGAAANEPEDYLRRDRYDRSTAQEAVLRKAVEIAGGDAHRFELVELYSCFPVVPKMALRVLGLDAAGQAPTVAGGLTFFGGPLNNYMSHAVCAMVRALRAAPQALGLLYGQGGYVNKHHALVVSCLPAAGALDPDFSVQRIADATQDPVPELLETYHGPATVETYTVTYGRSGRPLQGIVVARTPTGARLMARVMPQDEASMAHLVSLETSAVGLPGQVRLDVFGKLVWEEGAQPRDLRAIKRKYCAVDREGRLTIVTINRPEAMNALNEAANAELAEIFDDFAADPEQWVAILTGAGERAFSSGNDLKAFAQIMAEGGLPETPLTGYAGLTARFDLNKPVIAAVNGVAMGGGFEIALACDLIIAADTARFSLPEPKVGLAALAGGLHFLPRQIGLKNAMSMILTGRSVTAAEGKNMGFVNEVVALTSLMDTARACAASIMACSPMSIRASKEIVQRGLAELSLQSAYEKQSGYPAVRALFRSADIKEGPLAFAQKRAPQWKGH